MKKYTNILAVIAFGLCFVNMEAADKIRPNQISFNVGGNQTVGLPQDTGMMSRADFIKLFVTGVAKNIQIDAEWIKSYTTVQRDDAVAALLSDIENARESFSDDKGFGALRLLNDADLIADKLLKLVESETKEESKEPVKEDPKDVAARDKAILEDFMQSTKDTYIPNLQTLIIDNNFKKGDVVFQEAEDYGISLLKSHIKEDTKWTGITGNTLSLANNPHGMTLPLLKEMIASTMIVFDDPSCQFESNGFVSNKANNMHLSEFLVKHLSVNQAKVLSIQSQAASMLKITNLKELAASVNN